MILDFYRALIIDYTDRACPKIKYDSPISKKKINLKLLKGDEISSLTNVKADARNQKVF